MEIGRSKKQTPAPNSSDGKEAKGVDGHGPAIRTSKGRSPGKGSKERSESTTMKQKSSEFNESDKESGKEEGNVDFQGLSDGGQEGTESLKSVNKKAKAKKGVQPDS